MSNSPYDPPRAARFSQSLDHLCQWRGCQRPAHPDVPVPISVCGPHWVEMGQAYDENPMLELVREMRNDARYWKPPVGFPKYCLDCGRQVLVDRTNSSIVCATQGCTYRATLAEHQAASVERSKKATAIARQKYLDDVAAQRDGRQHSPVVYYIRFGDRIKIGTTTDMTMRMGTVPHDEVLAVEPGSFSVENRRHRQFAKLRVTREWFQIAPELTEHIEMVTNVHPDLQGMTRRKNAA